MHKDLLGKIWRETGRAGIAVSDAELTLTLGEGERKGRLGRSVLDSSIL